MNKKLINWWMGGATSYDAAVTALVTKATSLGYTLPSAEKLTTLSTFVSSLRSAGILALLDELKVYKYNDATLQNFSTLNIIDPNTYKSAVVGVNMTYGNSGWLGGASSALSTAFIPSGGTNFTLNNASMGCYVYNDALNGNPVMGTVGSAGATSRSYMYVRFTATSYNINLNSSATLSTGANASSIGLHSSNRVSSSTANYYIDGTLKESLGSVNTGALSDKATYVAGHNNNGAVAANTTQGVSMNYHGANLTGYMTALNNAWTTFNSSI